MFSLNRVSARSLASVYQTTIRKSLEVDIFEATDVYISIDVPYQDEITGTAVANVRVNREITPSITGNKIRTSGHLGDVSYAWLERFQHEWHDSASVPTSDDKPPSSIIVVIPPWFGLSFYVSFLCQL